MDSKKLLNDILVLSPLGIDDWLVMKDFTVKTSYGKFTVKKGYVTDLASIPKIFWAILPPFGQYSEASVIHDYLCGKSHPDRHKVFYELMIKYNTKKWKAKVMYYAVVLYGWYWDNFKTK